MSRFTCLIALGMSLGFAQVASAALVTFNSDNGLEGNGAFTGSMDYTFSNANNAQLIVTLKNTSPSAGGKLTAFAFEQPGGITGVGLSTATNLTNLLGGPTFNESISVSPFGDSDIGASLTSDWLGGGSPNGGVAIGATGSWTFTFTGTGLNLWTTQDFVSQLLVRFRGFDNGGSDKVPVPEASSIVLAGLGVAAVAAMIRRHRRSKAAE